MSYANSSLEFAMDDFDDCCDDVMSSNYNTFENNLMKFYQFLDNTSPFREYAKQVERPEEFDNWYQKAKSSRTGMVGSGELDWPLVIDERLGFQIALFRAIAQGRESVLDFCSNFMDAGTRLDDMVFEINDQLFRPFVRELRKLVERAAASPEALSNLSNIPASDRYVRLDHNQPDYTAAIEALNAVIEAVRASNDYASADPEDREQRLVELSAGRKLLESVRVRVAAASVLIVTTLTYLLSKFADAAIGDLAGRAITLVKGLLSL